MNRAVLAFVLLLLSLVAGVAYANDDYPARPVTMIVPYAAGGSSDVLGRVLAREMAKPLGQSVVVDLRPGAGGNLGAEIVAKNTPRDGYTFLFASASLSTSVALMKLNFDPCKDLVPVAGIATIPNLVVVSSESPYHSLADLVKAAKDGKTNITFGSSGPATSSHLASELLKVSSGADMLHVPYKGSGAVYPDLIAQRISFLSDIMVSAMGQVQGGKVRALAITSAHRSSSLPNVPTVAEQGYPGFEFGTWLGFFLPAGTPGGVQRKLEAASLAALRSDAVKERLEAAGAQPLPGPNQQFGRWYRDDVDRWNKLVHDGRIQPIQ